MGARAAARGERGGLAVGLLLAGLGLAVVLAVDAYR